MDRRLAAAIVGALLLPGIALLAVPGPPPRPGPAAGAVAVLHVAYLLYQAFGGLLALVDRRWLLPHLLAVTWGITIVVMRWPCPLTRLERALLERGGDAAYPTSFLDHYVFGVVLPHGTQAWVYGLHLVGIMATYVVVWQAWRRASRRPDATMAGEPSWR